MSAAATEIESSKPVRIETIGDAIRVFVRHPSPWMIYGTAAAAVTAKLVYGGWSWWDLLIAVWIVAFWPVQEWLIHVFILHFRPRKVAGINVDLHVARMHRVHHREPWDLKHVFVPTATVVTGLLVGLPLFLLGWYLLLPMSVGLTAVAVFFVFGSVYEWTHFIVHTGYKPKSAFYKKLWKHHRLHHFKNENYWWGVSRMEGDYLLGTAPDPATVQKSVSVRDLDKRDDDTGVSFDR